MYPLVDADVSVKEVIVAIISYIISLIIIQRFVYAVIYQVLVLGFLVYITSRNGESSFLHAIGLTMVALIGGANTLMMASRRAIISSLERYSSYLKNLLNSTGRGFVLFQWSDGWKIYDYNEETNNFLRSEAGHFDVRFFELFSEAEMEKIRRLREAGKFEKTVSFTNDMDGSIQYVAIEVSRIQFEQTDSLLAVITDVTEAYMRQRELLAREKRYRNLYDKNRAGVFTLDRNSVILDANTSFFSMFENSIDRGERLFDWEFKNEWKFILSSIEDNHQGQNYQTTYRLKNGNMKTFVFNWYQEASTGSIEGSVVDLTDTQRAAQALKQSEEKYRSIYEGSSDAIVLLDKDIIVEYNRSALQLFGIQDLKNSSLFNLSGDSSLENSRKYDREKEGLKSRKWIRFNWTFKSEKGEVETELSFQEIVIDGKLLYQCIIHDLTEQNRLVKEEIRARLAEETNIHLNRKYKSAEG
jgi:PAS domain S-box-containing protein